ncbi:discoidin domain-containing protein, partial [Cohnella sp. GCM10027633]|uniref:discoidin domain-containing protein n=1 Tax=unclassified Cohnella TaxID=2636738 RepID=UPI0036300CCF
MKRRLSLLLAIALAVGLLNVGLPGKLANVAYADPAPAASIKIPLSRMMVVNESLYGDPTALADQQGVAGDPRGGTGGGADSSFWYGAWSESNITQNYPAYAYIDLGQSYAVTDIYLRKRDKSGEFAAYAGSPGNWSQTELFADPLTAGNWSWIAHSVTNVETRYLRFKMSDFNAQVSEIVVYGVPISAKIALSPAMVKNETGYGNATRLVDEQTAAGDPKNGAGGAPGTFWFGAWEDPHNPLNTTYPIYAYLDLGREYYLTDVYLYDFNDGGAWDNYDAAFNVYTGSPGNWTAAFNAMHTYSNTWKSASLDSVKTRYVRVEMSQLAAIMSELVLYGSPAEAPLPPKIGLNISMVTGATDAYKLVDDQAAVGDPLHSPVSVNWGQLHGWNDWNGNAYIDLGQPFDVASIWLGDYLGSGGVKVYAGSGSPIAWTQLFTSGLNGYESWSKYNTSVTTQHIRVEKTGGGDMPEIVMYGTPVAKPILLMDTMATNVSGFDDVSKLVNQQAQAGDPLRGIGVQTGDANAVIAANVPTSSYPAEAVIDLGSLYDLTNVGLLDGSDMAASVTGAVYVYTGSPGNWGQPIAVDQMKNYGGWNMHPIKTTAQYVRIVKNSSNANLSEIVLYGTRVGGAIADAIPPAAVSNLAATAIGSNSATLRWIAPGDSGTAGTAASYEIRYGTSPITEGNWSAATLVAGAPAPLAAGSQQTMNVGGLTEETTYYFALKTTDGVGNVSGLSNVMTLTTAAVDIIAPAAVTNVSAVFLSGNAAKLTWTATGDDGATGAAASYEIRYSTSPITSGNWSAASAASFVPSPKAAGQAMSAWVNGLAAETAYYFAVGAKDEADNASALSNVASATTLTHDAGSKLELTADMIVNEGAHGDATKLVDQQAAAGSPRDGTGGQLNVDDSTVRWDLGTNNIYLPASAVIDLGVETEITDIYVYDGNGGNGLLTLSAGDPFNWQPLATDTLVNWKQWNRHQVNATTRYLQVKRATNADLTEIVVYGTPLGTPEAKPQPVAHVRPKMDELIGINAFIDDPMERMAVAGFIREYHNWNWDEGDLWNWGQLQTGYSGYPNNTNKFNPSYAGGGWNFDAYYDMLHDAGITVAPSIKESVGWLSNKANFKPISEGESATDPASYAEHSDHLFQFAARYGSTTVADNLLKLAEDQEELSGLGTLQYYENWNEHDKWWEGREGYFNPYEYAAMTSADYDGDQGRMGNTFGVKNADPNAKLVMSGLADPQLEYVRALKFWSEWNRGGSVPFDVINIHHYSNNGTDQQSGTAGISPEADNFLGKLKKFVDYRDQYMPGKEVWITEFGYDTNQQSPQKAPIIGSKSAEEVQGEWLVRSYLAASAAGVDKAAMYMLRDVDAASATRFDSSGLTGSKNTNWAPKISWYYVYTLKNQLAGMRYASELDSGNDDVKIYKYGNDSNSKDVYVLWAPTSDDTEVADYELTLSDSGTSVKLVTMTEGDTDGVESALTATGGKVTVDVNERPIYVVVNKGTVTPDPNHAPIISSPANGTTVSK